MARSKDSKAKTQGGAVVAENPPRSLTIAAQGIETAGDFASMMSALMSDLIEGRVTPQVGNATCNAGGKLLRIVELQYKYGVQQDGKPNPHLRLAAEGK
jgi:hypothetical protein